MHKLLAALAALRHGASLADPAGWKSRQNTLNVLVALIGAVLVLYPMGISHDDIAAIAGGLAAVLGLLNGYLTTATTTKLGLPPRHPPADRPPFPDLIDPPDSDRPEP
ncbi:hypothetical protein [Aromatoleum aromaticum]|uniref:hypothetical protein n=1 Tax=Aromatoleum aromaticum TaxID=551760 RepID=UPI0002F5202C|nr:hypothetical protein [Aromatoleum aromaticum]